MAFIPRLFMNMLFLFSALGTAALTFLVPAQALAHGSMESPVSRILNCRLENPENPHSTACKAAVAAGGTQPLYDWNGVRQGNANGEHQTIIPDGQLCSGGDTTFQGLDLPRADWPTTPLAPNNIGDVEFVFRATAPHATQYMEFYVTNDGYDPTKPLAWSDLESQPFCIETNPILENGRFHISCPLPAAKAGRHLIYHIWQRSDSPEAFYTCIDVEIIHDGGGDPSVPQDLGQIRAQQDLPVGSVLTFRLFEIDSSSGEFHDLDSHSVTVGEGKGSANQWPYHLAQTANVESEFIKVGVLQPDGSIQPLMDAQANHVYGIVDQQLDFEIDFQFPQPPEPSPPVVDFIYPEGRGQYQTGTVVLGSDGKRYECRPFPNSGWCNIESDLYYAPGTGLAWQEAWMRLDS